MSKKTGTKGSEEQGALATPATPESPPISDSDPGAVTEATDGLGPVSPMEESGEVASHLKPDYTGPLTVDQAIARRRYTTK
jgi:hypothetical protein